MDYVFPREYSNLSRMDRQYVDPRALPPRDSGFAQHDILQPRPDIAYGYKEDSVEVRDLKHAQNAELLGHDLSRICQPIPGLYRLFMLVEFKTSHGPMFAAVNQAAGSGTAASYATATLYRLANSGTPTSTDAAVASIAYTHAINGKYGTLYLCWAQEQPLQYNHKPVYTYNLQDPNAVRSIRNIVHNNMAWGLGARYELQEKCLRSIIDLHFADNPQDTQASQDVQSFASTSGSNTQHY